MDDYTPTTEEVREQYWAASGEPTRAAWSARAEFDRRLASVRADAWDEGNQAGWDDGANAQVRSEVTVTLNPYRGEKQ